MSVANSRAARRRMKHDPRYRAQRTRREAENERKKLTARKGGGKK